MKQKERVSMRSEDACVHLSDNPSSPRATSLSIASGLGVDLNTTCVTYGWHSMEH